MKAWVIVERKGFPLVYGMFSGTAYNSKLFILMLENVEIKIHKRGRQKNTSNKYRFSM